MIKKTILTLALFVACTTSIAQPTTENKKAYYAISSLSIYMSSLCANPSLGKVFEECVAESLSNLKRYYVIFGKELTTPAQKEALKNYYIAALTQMNGAPANENEPGLVYKLRQSSLQSKTDEAWVRFDVETM